MKMRGILRMTAVATVAVATLAAGLACEEIRVAPPPSPSLADSKAPAAFKYEHAIKKVARDRKPVLALLRAGDIAELKDVLPFGRTVIANAVNPDGSRIPTIVRGNPDAPVLLPVDMRAFLVRELLGTQEFIVLERERIVEIAREIALAKTAAVNPDTVVRPGRLIGVHYIVEGSYFAAGGLPADDPALADVRKDLAKRRLKLDPSQASVLYLTVYKVETGEVKAVACGADLKPMVAAKKAVEDLVDQLANIVEPVKVVGVNADRGLALLDIGSEDGTKAGDVFTLSPGGDGGAKPVMKAKVIKVESLSCIVSVQADDRVNLTGNMEAHRPKTEDAKAPAPTTGKPASATTEKSGT
jgi:hypothetical protein